MNDSHYFGASIKKAFVNADASGRAKACVCDRSRAGIAGSNPLPPPGRRK